MVRLKHLYEERRRREKERRDQEHEVVKQIHKDLSVLRPMVLKARKLPVPKK